MRDLDDITGEDRVIVEVKSVEQLGRQHAKQLLTYLKLTNRQVGLLINFGAPTLREGLRRMVNGSQPSAFPRLRVNQGAHPPGQSNPHSPLTNRRRPVNLQNTLCLQSAQTPVDT